MRKRSSQLTDQVFFFEIFPKKANYIKNDPSFSSGDQDAHPCRGTFLHLLGAPCHDGRPTEIPSDSVQPNGVHDAHNLQHNDLLPRVHQSLYLLLHEQKLQKPFSAVPRKVRVQKAVRMAGIETYAELSVAKIAAGTELEQERYHRKMCVHFRDEENRTWVVYLE